jgi:hypothetical protein
MKTARTVLALTLLVFVASPLFAAAGAKKAPALKNTVAYYRTIDQTLKPAKLTDDQKTKLDALKKDCEQKFKNAYAKLDVLTPEQKKAGEEARKTAKEAGKKGKELNKAVADAVKITEAQKEKAKEARASMKALQGEFHGKVFDLLTDKQKQQIKDAAKAKKRGKPAEAAGK